MSESMGIASGQADGGNDEVDDLDANERRDDAAQAIDQEVALQEAPGADRTVFYAAQRERHQRNDDQRVEDDRREDRAPRIGQLHDVERAERRQRDEEDRRDD